jgi:type I restriction enzyme S subunit
MLEEEKIGDLLKKIDDTIALHQRKYDLLLKLKKGYLQKLFPQNGETEPELRFTGFADAWEKRKLGEVAPFQRGFDLPKSEIVPGPYPVVFSNGIGAWNHEYKVEAPGIVTGRSGSIGHINYIRDNYWPHNTTLWVTSFNNNVVKFVYYLLEKINLKRFSSGTGVPTLNRNDVHSFGTSIPKNDEQQKIAYFLTSLDDTIALHQRKLDELKELKKAYLQKMFV